jgi:hypothetical protein
MPAFCNGYKPKVKRFPKVLLPTGENIFEVEPELAHKHSALRKKISAAQ